MTSKLRPSILPSSSFICPSCTRRIRLLGLSNQKRFITQNYLQKSLEAKLQWARQATEIKAGRKESMLDMLEKRGYVNQIVGPRDELDKLLTEKRVGIYCGVDPTAPSMHVGHLLPLMVLYWFYIKGFHACSLLGGATAQIGDPSWRTTSREVQHSSVRKTNMLKIHFQLKAMWAHVETRARDFGYNWEWAWRRELTNNNAWLNKLPAIEFLKLAGRGTRLGPMLGRDTVKNRIKSKEGMSFAEFTYPLLQAWDWWYMYSTKDIQIQIGGSDQFGNILAGIDTINYIRFHHYDPELLQDEKKMSQREALLKRPMGFTVPLLTKASGEKFSKSAGSAIWLDREMTSAFDLYQFFLRMADADVHRYLKLFTFEPLEILDKLMEEHNKDPSKRVAQHKLAKEVLIIVHGSQVAKETEEQHRSLFRKTPIPYPPMPAQEDGKRTPHGNRAFNENAPVVDANSAPFHSINLPRSLVYNQLMERVLFFAGMVASRNEGHRMVSKGGAYVGARPGGSGTMSDQVDWSPATNWQPEDTEKYIIGGDTLLLRIGKWKVKIVKIISDEEFDERGLKAPGWEEWKERKLEEPLTDDVKRMKLWSKKNYIKTALLHQRGPDPDADIIRARSSQ